ncbi:MAG: two component system sensor kinase [Actinomycetia bacterium]|nr:two component system sensor kinase [Actinomycetes bacterium]
MQRFALRRADVLVALVVGVFQVVGTFFASQHHQATRLSLSAFGLALVAVGPVALVVRRRYPAAVLAVTFASTLAYWAADYPRGPVFFALLVAFVNAVTQGRRPFAWALIPIGWASFLWLGPSLGRMPAPSLPNIFGLAAWLLVLPAGTELLRARREHTAEVKRVAVAEGKQRSSDERLRIARDLHDVVAHNISLINVQAGVALHLIDEKPEQARTALAAIKQASKETLGELRSVLDALRGDGEDAPLVPAPTLDDVGRLVERTSAAGLPVELVIAGEQRRLPVAVELAAFRIVQEAITNVTRHAGATGATVRLEYRNHELLVQIDDDGAGNGSATGVGEHGGSGTGIIGMRERAHALGGTLSATPTSPRGFRVRAQLPIGNGE